MFYKRIIVIACAVQLAMVACQTDAQTGSGLAGPRIKADIEIFDFGVVPQGYIVSHTYWLRNPGSETAVITKLQPNCGCTQIPPTDSLIEVGDSIPVRVEFGTARMIGKVEKFTRITSNAQGKVPALTIRARVLTTEQHLGPVVASPWFVDVDTTKQDAFVVHLNLKNASDANVKVRSVRAGSRITMDGNELQLTPGQSYDLPIRILPGAIRDLPKSLTFEVIGAEISRMTVPLRHQ